MKKSSNAYAVIGLGFGDEGKGLTVNSLCQQLRDPLVVRYSGGQQAGHTVTLPDGTSHVFSNFGSGTFKGVPTYWSKYCTFDPVGVAGEYEILKNKGAAPLLYIDKRSPITTPYEKVFNQQLSHALNHGTCGLGVGATYQREEDLFSLTAGDIMFPAVVELKLKLIREYYEKKIVMRGTYSFDVDLTAFMESVHFIRNRYSTFILVEDMPTNHANIIFESSQGLLLDQNTGFFPHVTRSNVGTKNILEMGYEPELFLVTRAFQTRHGNGPMTNASIPHNIKENPKETNVLNRYQGEFKRSLLDLDLLRYGMSKDPYIKAATNKNLVITCLDLVENELRYTVGGGMENHTNEDSFITNGIAHHLGIYNTHRIRSPDGIVEVRRRW
jgi:adenylosuccinate synthase